MTNKNELADAVDKLIPSLAAIFPAWRQAISTPDEARMVKREWYMALSDANVTPNEVAQGLSKARKHDSPYLPSCGMFLGWCRSKTELSKFQAWQMASMSSDLKPINDPMVFEAAKRTGIYDIKNRNERDIKPLFFDHYEDVLRERFDGAQFYLPAPDKNPDHTDPVQTDEDRARGRKVLDKLLNDLNEDMKP
jgi:hypothetical protein